MPKFKADAVTYGKTISCSYSRDDEKQYVSKNDNDPSKGPMVALAAAILALGPADGSFAARTGGRVGGQFFRSSVPDSKPFIKKSRKFTVTPPVYPLLVGGSGDGIGMPFYGSWGWTPSSLFGPGPCEAEGIKTLLLFIFLGAAAAVVRKYFVSRNEDGNN